ncbi:ATP-binding cassette domain-containing protein [Glycomyces sp. TRM65418]|uniref:ATP-binding cassette domain-containing protein n=1 Tax=Glycomyces sp. TRM65418 TaxID=2867006 RepID=UPI001CE6037A|nr:ATP-binding cassette domain-containing protein [Glycomyces sp. TRM65418]MCC3762745.1 ATP-binding cassette domain-containing protein [Glycomyces sp. TRM65418]QZD56777.1 ATP-binding cassette domain-containing protein [Glycomyces sp. TRM65418]
MLIETKGLKKTFKSRGKSVEAVRGVDLAVKEGEIFGLLGPNGAGKTTTMRILSTLIEPTEGAATVCGHDLAKEAAKVRRDIGYVGQHGGTWGEVTAREELVLQGRLYDMSKRRSQERAAEVLESFQLAEYADRNVKTYSGGQKRRLDIALGIMHEPKLLFLDEPTTGLDPQSRAHMWDEVRALRDRGTAVFLTTHYLDEADALCDRLAIIDHGEIVVEGTPNALKRQVAGDVVAIGVNGAPEGALALLRGKDFVREAEAGEPDPATGIALLRLYVDDGAAAVPELLRALDAEDIAPASIELHRPSLDDVFLKQTGRSLREEK